MYGEGLMYSMIVAVEETMEMAGIILFIYSMMKYLEAQVGGVLFYFGDSQSESNYPLDGVP